MRRLFYLSKKQLKDDVVVCHNESSSHADAKEIYSPMTFNDSFNNWIRVIIKSENPGKTIIAYKFGLFETPDVPSGYYLYLIGSKEYNEGDDDWASGMGDFKPKDTYLPLPETEFKKVHWEKVQEMVITTVKRFIKSDDFKSSFFNNAKAIAVGFDEGDLVRVK
jgi:hypothetical protein